VASMADPSNAAGYQYVWVANNTACGLRPVGTYYCVLAKLEESTKCSAGQKRYFVVSSVGVKEVCSANDYVATPPTCAECLSM
jgi:hypothetical protein